MFPAIWYVPQARGHPNLVTMGVKSISGRSETVVEAQESGNLGL
jgi:hypothetical protein